MKLRRKLLGIASISLASLTLVCVIDSPASAKPKKGKRTITTLSLDPSAEKVSLFDGMDAGTLDVKMIAKDSLGGNLLIENKTDQPLTVEMPDAIVGVQVLKQIGGGGYSGGGGGSFGGGGGGQSVGGGGGGGFGGGGAGGGGFFSIPPETVARVPYNSVCLEHGKAEPNSRMTYQVIPVEQFSNDERLMPLLKIVANGKVSPQAAQAAAWHMTNEMSWNDLASKSRTDLRTLHSEPYFNAQTLNEAKSIVARAMTEARNEATGEGESEPAPTKSRVNRVEASR